MIEAPSPIRIPNKVPPVKCSSFNPAVSKLCIEASEMSNPDVWGRSSPVSRTPHEMTASDVATLGIDTKTVSPLLEAGFTQNSAEVVHNGALGDGDFIRRQSRAKRYDHQQKARHILTNEGMKMVAAGTLEYAANFHRTCKCLYVSVGKNTINVDERGNAFYGGLPLCGSVWVCALCSAKIQEKRRHEIEKAVNWAYESGGTVVMVTFTFPHNAGHGLKDLLDKQMAALRFLRGGTPWLNFKKEISLQGFIKSLEITIGENGWHPHTHELWFVRKDLNHKHLWSYVTERWRRACIEAGLLDENDKGQLRAFYKHSVDIKFNVSASGYLAKLDDSRNWGADREMTKGGSKDARSKGRNPLSLLDTADIGNRDADLFLEYCAAMKGKNQIVWSPGLKKRVGVDEKTDQEHAEDSVEKSEVLATLKREDWKLVCKEDARAEVLDLAELKGFEGIQSFFSRYGLYVQKGLLPDGMNDDGLHIDWKLNRAGLAAQANDDVLENHQCGDLDSYTPDSALKKLDQAKVEGTRAELQNWRKKEARRKRESKRTGVPTRLKSARDLMTVLAETS